MGVGVGITVYGKQFTNCSQNQRRTAPFGRLPIPRYNLAHADDGVASQIIDLKAESF
ncbi:MAG: hypothetical protein M5U34_02450 [Chloroflexi bacterium]|nr:hypothetical protein [Chloroflexota bacterium]